MNKEYSVSRMNDTDNSFLRSGFQHASDVIGSTMGPGGRGVLIYHSADGQPVFTRDGVTVSRQLTAKDQVRDMGYKIVRGACDSTNTMAGDGTTATAVLCGAFLSSLDGFTKIKSFLSKPILDSLCDDFLLHLEKHLEKLRMPASESVLRSVATTAVGGNAALGGGIMDIVSKIGKGRISFSFDPSKGKGVTTEILSGYNWGSGFVSSEMYPNARPAVNVSVPNPVYFLFDGVLDSDAQVKAIVTAYVSKYRRVDGTFDSTLVIIANDITSSATASILRNLRKEKSIPVVGIRSHSRGVTGLTSLSVGLGCSVFSLHGGLSLDSIGKVPTFGHSASLVVSPSVSTIVFSGDDVTVGRIGMFLEEQKAILGSEEYAELYSQLVYGVGNININMPTQEQGSITMMYIEDAIRSVRTTIEFGALPGCGYALLSAYHEYVKECGKSDTSAMHSLYKSLCAPHDRIMQNASLDWKRLAEAAINAQAVYNISIGAFEVIGSTQILDSYYAVLNSVKNALSAATTIYGTGYTVSWES